jgi:hypothetical protein
MLEYFSDPFFHISGCAIAQNVSNVTETVLGKHTGIVSIKRQALRSALYMRSFLRIARPRDSQGQKFCSHFESHKGNHGEDYACS